MTNDETLLGADAAAVEGAGSIEREPLSHADANIKARLTDTVLVVLADTYKPSERQVGSRERLIINVTAWYALRVAREYVRGLEQKTINHELTSGLTRAGQGYHAASQNIGDYLEQLIAKFATDDQPLSEASGSVPSAAPKNVPVPCGDDQ